MVEMNGNMLVKCEPNSEEAELLNSLVANGDDHLQELRFLCLCKLKVSEDTVALLEAQQIDVECLRKMRVEDVDVLFDGKPLGPKIIFREAFLEWREEIGLPCKSIRSLSCRKRSCDSYEPLAENESKHQLQTSPPIWDDFNLQPQTVLQEREAIAQHDNPAISYRTFPWPMTPSTLKDVLNSSAMGRSIMAMGCLGGLGKSLQYQLTAIIIDYHMEYEVKITTPQLENYAYCITTLLPHENTVSRGNSCFRTGKILMWQIFVPADLSHSAWAKPTEPGRFALFTLHQSKN